MKSCANEALDKALYTWFNQERNRGTPLSGPILEKGLWYHQQLHSGDSSIGIRGREFASFPYRRRSFPMWAMRQSHSNKP